MARFSVVCFVYVNFVIGLAAANEKLQTIVQPNTESFPHSPAPSPSSDEHLYKAQAPVNRKLGNHHQAKKQQPSIAPGVSPSKGDKNAHSMGDEIAPSRPNIEEDVGIQGQGSLLAKPQHHHAMDKSVAGGGVILGGLATTFLVAVFCYIRATKRHNSESASEVSV
ncbi:hypothetical protein Tsubulata_007995 [Turnera subulata]|uniref:Transmembrane protein n=1 Tax=Turnera subulata TaxID=218843 RepID=A0A9Q0FL51_9ROSI|nr:hypothetical protein Tsubulata_007995 [Turnera subulata]